MANAPPISQMRAQFESLLTAGWGVNCAISRLSGTTDQRGHVVGTFATLVTSERVWIQANSGRSKVDEINLDAETTHFAYQALNGTALLPKDKVLPSGASYIYDVIRAHVFETHRMAELKQDLRVLVRFLILEDLSNLLQEDGQSKFLMEIF